MEMSTTNAILCTATFLHKCSRHPINEEFAHRTCLYFGDSWTPKDFKCRSNSIQELSLSSHFRSQWESYHPVSQPSPMKTSSPRPYTFLELSSRSRLFHLSKWSSS